MMYVLCKTQWECVMRRILLGMLCTCMFAFFSIVPGPAKAGDYYYGYHHPRSASRVWYTSSCCYRRIVRHVTTSSVRYVRIRPYRYSNWRRYRYYRPWRYYHYRTYDYGHRYWPRRTYRDYRYADDVRGPECRLVRIADLDGGWIWARRAGCD